MGVSDELAALRSKGTVKQHASALKSKSGSLSTPEAEEASLSKLKKEDRTKKAQAEELLRKTNAAGGGLVDQELKKVGERKKQFEKGRVEARTLLKKGATGGGLVDVSLDKKGKKQEADDDTQASQVKETEAPKAAPQANESPEADVSELDDMPQLDDDDNVPDLEEANEASAEPAASKTTTEAQTTNRNEKKVRKMMSRLDMRPIPNIARATFKTSQGTFFIDSPHVYAPSKCTDSYSNVVIFGDARQQQSPLFQKNANAVAAEAVESMRQNRDKSVEVEETAVTEGDVVNEEGLEAKDVELVMTQASVERSVAVKALRENDGDLVNAIMSLTT